MAGGGLQKAGFWTTVAGVALILAGYFTGGATVPYGTALLLGGTVLNVAGAFITPITAETGSNSKRDSPTYGYAGAQYQNRFKGDAPIPFQFGRLKQAPTISQVFTTPRGLGSYDDFARISRAEGQAISMELIGGEGPIKKIEDLEINGTPAYEKFEDEGGTPRFLRNGPGSGANDFRMELPGKRVWLPTIEIYVDGVQKAWVLTNRTSTFTGNGTDTTFVTELSDATDLDIAEEFPLIVKINGAVANLDDTTFPRPYCWLDGTGNARKLFVDTGFPMPSGMRLDVTMVVRKTEDGIRIVTDDDVTSVVWPSAQRPATSAKITAKFQRALVPGVSIEFRYGGDHQLPLTGFHDQRQTYAISGGELTSGGVTGTTTNEVDDIVLDFASQSTGFYSIDKNDGGHGPVTAIIKIEYKPAGASASLWQTLNDPKGASGLFSDKKGADEFALSDEATSQRFWSFSVRGILKKLVEKNPSKWSPVLARFTRQKYDFRVRRTNPRRYTATSGGYYIDRIDLISRQEVTDEWLAHPGTWKVGFHGLGSAKVNGQVPTVTCVPTGLVNVRKVTLSGSTYAWATTTDSEAQFNNVWAASHVFHNKVFGGGPQFTIDDIDKASAYAAAAWCDEQILVSGTGTATEVRARLDYSGDTRQSLLATLGEMLAPAFVIPVMQGDTLKFVIDKAVTLSAVPTIYDDGQEEENDTLPGAGGNHESPTADVTELYVDFYDETDGWERKPVLVSPRQPADNRRIKRAEIRGCTRKTQATRVAQRLYAAATARPSIPGMAITLRPRIWLEAGDVFRFISQRLGCDLYLRIYALSFDTPDCSVKLECREYVPSVYAQQDSHARILSNPKIKTRPAIPQLALKAKKVLK